MKNILHIILISIISLIVISCAKKSDSSSSSSTCTSSDVSFLAVGASGTILTSADGTCWTAQTSGTTNNLRAFAIKPSTIGVVVGYSGTILTTTDGTPGLQGLLELPMILIMFTTILLVLLR